MDGTLSLTQDANVQEFLDALTELSRKHKVGVAGAPAIFVMEDDDYERTYRSDGRRIEFV